MAIGDRTRQPAHEMTFEMNSTWMIERVQSSVTVVTGDVVCYMGTSSSGYPVVSMCTRGDTSTLHGSAVFSALAHRKVAGIVLQGTAAGDYTDIVIGGKVDVKKVATSMDQTGYVGLSTVTAGSVDLLTGVDVKVYNAFGVVAENATAGDSTVSIWMLPWRA
jgi:hypothetical protein